MGWTNKQELLQIIKNPSKKNIVEKLSRFIAEHIADSNQDKIPPRMQAYLANTLLLNYVSKGNNTGIDKQVTEKAERRIHRKSECICKCESDEIAQIDELEGEFPCLCAICGYLKHISELEKQSNCKTCGSRDTQIKMSPSGVCISCTTKWLLIMNSMNTRYSNKLQLISEKKMLWRMRRRC